MKREAGNPASMREITQQAAALSAAMPGGSFGADAVATPITGGGSDRDFFRISECGKSAVLLVDRSAEFEHYVSIGRFLCECGVAVPEFYGTDEEEQAVLMEDLGSIHLEEALRAADADEELSLYRKALTLLATLQSHVTDRMMEAGLLAERRFDRRRTAAPGSTTPHRSSGTPTTPSRARRHTCSWTSSSNL
jgi:aminoglycoside/choline kinase family phosphotransferase